MNISAINSQFPAIFDVMFFCIGACVGSFLNVCIYRIPAGRSIIKPASHCACGKPIAFFDNIPILSWFFLRGRARCCKRHISFRYPLVEALTAGIFLAMWKFNTPHAAIAGMIFASIMIFCTFVDIDTMMLPDFATVGGMFLGFLLSMMMPQIHNAAIENAPFVASVIASTISSVIGAVVGCGVLYLIRLVGGYVFRKEAMGEGDVLLMACIGSFCGWQGALFAIFGGSVIGALTMVPLVATKRFLTRKNPKFEANKSFDENPPDPLAIPFGPWLALGGLAYYILFRDATDIYFASIANAFFGS